MGEPDAKAAAKEIVAEFEQAEKRASGIMDDARVEVDKVFDEVWNNVARKDGPVRTLRKTSSGAKKKLKGDLCKVCFGILVDFVALDLQEAYSYSDMRAFLSSNPTEFNVPLLSPRVGILEQMQLIQFAAQHAESMDDAKLTEAVRSMFDPHIENGLLPPGTEVFARRDKEGGVEIYGTLSL